MNDIYARVPVNKIAALVTGRGEHFAPRKFAQNNDRDTPIETRPLTPVETNAQGFIDLSKRRVGRFTVLGISRDFPRQWVVRCDCGRYSTRSAKAIKNKDNGQDRCEHCRHLAQLKRSEHWRRTRRDIDIRNF